MEDKKTVPWYNEGPKFSFGRVIYNHNSFNLKNSFKIKYSTTQDFNSILFLAYQSTLRHELMLMHVNEKSAKCNVNACERKNVMFMHVNEKSAKCNY
jgi:hypothetical protein